MGKLRALAFTGSVLAACVGGVPSAQGEYAIFGNLGVSIDASATVSGTVASNYDVLVNPFSTFTSLQGGGTLFGGGTGGGSGAFTVTGETIFNGDVQASSSATFGGTIHAGGSVDLTFAQGTTGPIVARGNVLQGQSATTNGDILAGGSFINQNFSVVNGNVHANGSVYVNGTVNGNVTYLGVSNVGTFGKITGTRTVAATVVNPAAYVPITTPAATAFTSGGANITQGNTLATTLQPGSYGSVNIPTFGNLHLTAGDYFFDSVTFNGNAIYINNLTEENRLRIFVTGDVYQTTFSTVYVNGVAFTGAANSLADNVLLETHGKYFQTPPGLGSVDFFGTIFAPFGDITIGNYSDLKGALVAGGQVKIGVGFNMPFAAASVPVPEPASLGVLAAGGMMLLKRRRR